MWVKIQHNVWIRIMNIFSCEEQVKLFTMETGNCFVKYILNSAWILGHFKWIFAALICYLCRTLGSFWIVRKIWNDLEGLFEWFWDIKKSGMRPEKASKIWPMDEPKILFSKHFSLRRKLKGKSWKIFQDYNL
jgi:hypothetical protein